MAGPNRVTGNGAERVIQRKSRVLLTREMRRVATQAKAIDVSIPTMKEEGGGRVKFSKILFKFVVWARPGPEMFLSSEGTPGEAGSPPALMRKEKEAGRDRDPPLCPANEANLELFVLHPFKYSSLPRRFHNSNHF